MCYHMIECYFIQNCPITRKSVYLFVYSKCVRKVLLFYLIFQLINNNNNKTDLAWLMISENHSYGNGQWTPDMRKRYNLADAVSRHTVQVNENSFYRKKLIEVS